MSVSDVDLALSLKNLRVLVSEKIEKKQSTTMPKPFVAATSVEQNLLSRLMRFIQHRDDLE